MGVDLEALRKKHLENKNKNTGGSGEFGDSFLQLEEGTTLIRILPSKDDEVEFYAETAIHYIEDAEGNKKSYQCRATQNEACPLCEAKNQLWKIHNQKGYKGRQKSKWGNKAAQISGKTRYYLNVLAVNSDDRDESEVKILPCGKIIFEDKIVATMLDEDFGDITDLKTGHDFKIIKRIEGIWPKYDQSGPRPKPSKAGSDAAIAKWMDSLHDIHALVKLEDYDELKTVADTVMAEMTQEEEKQEDASDENFLEQLKV